eukprot:Colp12_sorted_trinity150504_noHs@8471
MVLNILFESASGYALFEAVETEEIGLELESVQQSVLDLAKFGKIVKLKAFIPFTSAQNALENINSISEGILHDTLKNFLEANLPKVSKKGKFKLAVSHEKIGQAIHEAFEVSCDISDVAMEFIRGIRMHFAKFIKGLKDGDLEKAQLGLGHSYSRAKVKFNVHRSDNMIIQSISLLDQLDKDINTFAMRLREWYSYHFPELIKVVSDNYTYARLVQLIGARKNVNEDLVEKMEEITMDSAKAKQIVDAAKASMGMDVSDIDLISIHSFADRVVSQCEYRAKLHEYLTNKMKAVAPNLASLVGDQVGARLIAHAGSLTNLAKYPASTVQILGAEKALFRALKTKGNTPKYGLIFHSTFIGRAGAKNKGRISRYLANKCSIASRIDCFTETPTQLFGTKLKDQVEERLRFYETGEAPTKNLDAMKDVISQLEKEEKSSKKRKAEEVEDEAPVDKSEKKKKKKKEKEAKEEEEPAAMEVDEPVSEKKKKKKKEKEAKEEEEPAAMEVDEPVSEKKKKKKK